jgi:polysaccharide export outer membrane protein
MYLVAAAFSIVFGAGVGFAQPADSEAHAAPAAITPIRAETVIEAPETEIAGAEGIAAVAPVRIAASRTAAPAQGYRLGTGDKIRVTVYGETDLSGEFVVDGSGYVRLPLIGQVMAAGRDIHEFEGDVAAKLSEGYLRSPRVSAEVVNYRPFFILGEVNKPGEYPYVNGMNVVTAVALAGGYTYRADEDDVYIRRGGRAEEEFPADERTAVMPGDIIRVTERFF